jgi:hypothetical protein
MKRKTLQELEVLWKRTVRVKRVKYQIIWPVKSIGNDRKIKCTASSLSGGLGVHLRVFPHIVQRDNASATTGSRSGRVLKGEKQGVIFCCTFARGMLWLQSSTGSGMTTGTPRPTRLPAALVIC